MTGEISHVKNHMKSQSVLLPPVHANIIQLGRIISLAEMMISQNYQLPTLAWPLTIIDDEDSWEQEDGSGEQRDIYRERAASGRTPTEAMGWGQ